jgi:biotin operon repressor
MSVAVTANQPKPGTKQALFLNRLEGEAVSVADLAKATGWKNHTVRAAMTRFRKRGFQIERVDLEDGAHALYRLKAAESASRKRRSK